MSKQGKHHDLKIWPVFFSAVRDGTKTFEVRTNDRDFKEGDSVTLMEYSPQAVYCSDGHGGHKWTHYTGEKLGFRIGFVYQLDKINCVFSLLPLVDVANDG